MTPPTIPSNRAPKAVTAVRRQAAFALHRRAHFSQCVCGSGDEVRDDDVDVVAEDRDEGDPDGEVAVQQGSFINFTCSLY